MKPILFNTEMVRAILDGRKTVTRRIIKPQPKPTESCCVNKFTWYYKNTSYVLMNDCDVKRECAKAAPCQPGENLYVRETWRLIDFEYVGGDWNASVQFYADGSIGERLHNLERGADESMGWRPSIHMPKEAARIFLRVNDVRVERLQDILKYPPEPNNQIVREGFIYGCDFIAGWDSTIKPANRAQHGWDANPWVWVIEFERCEKPETEQ